MVEQFNKFYDVKHLLLFGEFSRCGRISTSTATFMSGARATLTVSNAEGIKIQYEYVDGERKVLMIDRDATLTDYRYMKNAAVNGYQKNGW
jgi:hypothetical protein